MIKEIPILFSTPMVQANLEGRKTMTRRMTGLEKINENPDDWQFEWADFSLKFPWCFTQKLTVNEISLAERNFNQERIKCPYGQPGDMLWVRESFQNILREKGKHENIFKADPLIWGGKWKPSIHMPKVAARIWLQVEEIRLERLNEIHYQDAIAEGIERFGDDSWKDYQSKTGETYYSNPRLSFKSLFLSINGKPKPVRERGETGKILSYTAIAWDQEDYEKTWRKFYGEYRNKPLHVIINPWVWVVKFKVLSTTGKPSLEQD